MKNSKCMVTHAVYVTLVLLDPFTKFDLIYRDKYILQLGHEAINLALKNFSFLPQKRRLAAGARQSQRLSSRSTLKRGREAKMLASSSNLHNLNVVSKEI